MPASSINRKTVRDALTTGLTAVLVGSGKPVDVLYGYNAGDLGGRLCVACVVSQGTERTPPTDGGGLSTFDPDWSTNAFFDVLVFSAYSWANEAGELVWDEEDCQERIDLCEKIIADYLADNFGSISGCDYVTYAGRTEIGVLDIGTNYVWERHPLKAVKFNG